MFGRIPHGRAAYATWGDQPAAPPDLLTLALDLTVEYPSATLRLGLALAVSEAGALALPLHLTVAWPSGTLTLPLELAVGPTGTLTLPLALAVADAAAYNQAHALWRPVVRVGGADVSARLAGRVEVEATEGAARIAELALVPEAGAMNLTAWVGKEVAIDYAQASGAGAPLYPWRLFTGVVDVPQWDAQANVIRLRCTDDLQGVMARLSRSAIDALVGGEWSAAVFAADADGWDYAQDRLSTTLAALDLDAQRSPRVSALAAAVTARWEYGAAQILDESLAVEWAQRAAVRNVIEATFSYRFPRYKRRVIHAGYRYPFSLDQVLINGYRMPTVTQILGALEGTGWDVVGKVSFTHPPAGPILVDLGGGRVGVWVTTDLSLSATTTIQDKTLPNQAYVAGDEQVAAELVTAFGCRLTRRYVQTVEERYVLRVENAASLDALGPITEARSAALEARPDTSAWEQWRAPQPRTDAHFVPAGDSYEPAPVLPLPARGEVYQDYTGTEADRGAAQAAIRALVAQAQGDIVRSHRGHRVRFGCRLNPLLDLTDTARVNTPRVLAKGKLVGLRHVMDLDAGSATSALEVAIYASSALGLPAHSTPAAPAAPAVAEPTAADYSARAGTYVGSGVSSVALNDTMVGFFTNVGRWAADWSPSAPVYPEQFSLETPEIEAASRDNLVVPVAQSYQAALADDEFVITA